MAWALGPSGETYLYRLAVTVDTTGITPGASYDAAITVGPDLEAFWATVQSNGYDIALGYGDSTGLIPYLRHTWLYAARGAVLRCTATMSALAVSGSVQVLYLYWGPSDGVAVTGDPSTGSYTPTVTGSTTAPLIYPDGPTIALSSASWQQDASSNTPSPAQTVLCGLGEGRWAVLDTGPGARYPAGYSYNGHDVYQDVGWVHVAVTGADASAPTWATSLGLRFAIDDTRGVLRSQIDVTHASDGLAVYHIGRSQGRSEKHYIRIRGIEPAL